MNKKTITTTEPISIHVGDRLHMYDGHYVVTDRISATTVAVEKLTLWLLLKLWAARHPLLTAVAFIVLAIAISYSLARLDEPQSVRLWSHIL